MIPIELLRELLDLDVTTGRLTWRARFPRHFTATPARSADHICELWNSMWAGTAALASVDGSGHLTGRINGRLVYAHRVVFAMVHGHWPIKTIDHINGDPADNTPQNLRDVSHQENHRNTKLFKNGSSGVTGVSFNRRLGKWGAHITVSGAYHHLGFHKEKASAIEARKQAELRFGFHPNHGRKAHANHA